VNNVARSANVIDYDGKFSFPVSIARSPAPVGSYEDLVRRGLLVREVGRLVIHEQLSERAVAKRLGIARSTVRRLLVEVRAMSIASGVLTRFRVGDIGRHDPQRFGDT
jgi:hypothetical protein